MKEAFKNKLLLLKKNLLIFLIFYIIFKILILKVLPALKKFAQHFTIFIIVIYSDILNS